MTATTPPAPPNPLAPSAEPQIYVGIITSILVSAGLVTTGEATTLQPLLLAVIVALPTVLAIIQRQFATPNSKVAVAVQQAVTAATSIPPVTTAPATPPPAPVTTSTGSKPVADQVPSLADAITKLQGYIAELEAVPNPSAAQTAELATYRARLTEYQGRLAPAAPPAPVVPAPTPAPAAFDPNAPYPGNPSVTIAQAAGIDAAYQVAKLRPDAGPTSAALAAFDGAAAKYGYNGVVGISIPGGQFLVVFIKGRIVGTEQGTGTTDTVALARQYGLSGNNFGTVTP